MYGSSELNEWDTLIQLSMRAIAHSKKARLSQPSGSLCAAARVQSVIRRLNSFYKKNKPVPSFLIGLI